MVIPKLSSYCSHRKPLCIQCFFFKKKNCFRAFYSNMQPKHMDILLVTLLISEVQSSPCLLKANFSPSAHSKSPNAKAMAIRTPQTYHMKYSLQSQKNCPRWKCEAKLLKIDQDILVIIWPDFIYLAIWILLDHYMHYVVLHFFNVTMNCRYSDIPIDDVRKVCPACRGICNCRVCLLGDNVIKVFNLYQEFFPSLLPYLFIIFMLTDFS